LASSFCRIKLSVVSELKAQGAIFEMNFDRIIIAMESIARILIYPNFKIQRLSHLPCYFLVMGFLALHGFLPSEILALNNHSDTGVATSIGSSGLEVNCDQLNFEQGASSEVLENGSAFISPAIQNPGPSDIDNWTSITEIPPGFEFDYFETPYVNGLNQPGRVYIESSARPGTWQLAVDFHANNPQTISTNNLILLSGETVTRVKLEMGTIPGDGTWYTPEIQNGVEGRFRIYGDVTAPEGTIIESCSTLTGDVNGEACSGNDCSNTTVVSPAGGNTSVGMTCDLEAEIGNSGSCSSSSILNNNGGFEDTGSVVFNTSFQGIPAAMWANQSTSVFPSWYTVLNGFSGDFYLFDDAADQVNNPEGDHFVVKIH